MLTFAAEIAAPCGSEIVPSMLPNDPVACDHAGCKLAHTISKSVIAKNAKVDLRFIIASWIPASWQVYGFGVVASLQK